MRELNTRLTSPWIMIVFSFFCGYQARFILGQAIEVDRSFSYAMKAQRA